MLFHDWLKNDSKIILFDGAMGTEIFKRGIEPGKIPDVLNIEKPDIISDIHKSYYDVGSDMCQTCTFGSSSLNLKKYKLEDRIEEINQKALENIKKICPPNCVIVGDIGPSGEFRPPVGNITIEQWQASFVNQVKILEDGVDLWHIETISDIEEMKTAIKAVKAVSKKPIIASMTYKKTPRGYFTIMGDSLEKCIQILEQENVDVIGSNCTISSNDMIGLIKESTILTNKPLSAKPNAGMPKLDNKGKAFYDYPVKMFAKDIHNIIDLGAKIVGGCCGTSPETIKEIRKIIDSL